MTNPKRLLLRAVADRAAAVASACMAAMLGPKAADAVQAHVVPDEEAGCGERRQAHVEAARRLAL